MYHYEVSWYDVKKINILTLVDISRKPFEMLW